MEHTIVLVIIGNIISLVAACFTAASSWATDKRKMFFHQVWQCALLAVAALFFQSYAGIPVLILCVVRNALVAKEKYTKFWCIILTIAILVFGIIFNNRGWVGWVVIIASGIYSVGIYVLKTNLRQKYNYMLNLLLWMIYELMILDFVSFVTDAIGFVVTFRAVYRLKKDMVAGED